MLYHLGQTEGQTETRIHNTLCGAFGSGGRVESISWPKWQNEVTVDNFCAIEGVMLLSGYKKLSSRHHYWDQGDDVYSKMVAENIGKSKLVAVLSRVLFAQSSVQHQNWRDGNSV